MSGSGHFPIVFTSCWLYSQSYPQLSPTFLDQPVSGRPKLGVHQAPTGTHGLARGTAVDSATARNAGRPGVIFPGSFHSHGGTPIYGWFVRENPSTNGCIHTTVDGRNPAPPLDGGNPIKG